MANEAEKSNSARTALIVVIVLLFGGAGFGIWKMNQSEEVPKAEVASDAATQTAAAPTTAPAAAEPAPAAEPAAAPEPAAPAAPAAASFDVVRVDPDGTATVAGRGQPGATIRLMVDGNEVASAPVGADGKFATVFTLSASNAPRMLMTVQKLADGTEVPGGASIAIAPVADAQVQVAEAGAASTDAAATEAPAEAATAPAEAPTAVIVDDQGVTVAQTGGGEGVSLAAIAYDAAGAVELAGKAHPGNIVQVYVDNTLAAAVDVGADGSWSARPEVAPGVYTLRLDEVDPAGKVVSRFETPFKRETLEALAAAQAAATASADTAPAAEAPAADAAATTEAAPAATTEPAPADTAAASTEASAADTAAAATTTEPAPDTATAAATTTEAAPAADAGQTADAGTAAEPAPAADTTAAEAPAAPAADAATAAAGSDTAATATAAAEPAAQPAADAAATEPPPTVTITVLPGYTLWGIAKANLGSGIQYLQIFEANRGQIADPDLIYPGQVFVLPRD